MMFFNPTVPTSDVEWRDYVIHKQQNLAEAALSLSGSIRKSYADLLVGTFSNNDLFFLLLEDQLMQLRNLTAGWDSYDAPAPSGETMAGAQRTIEKLRTEQLLPEAVTPSAEGGVAIYFSRGAQKAFIEFLNEGETLLALYGKDDEPNVRVLREGPRGIEDQAVQEIRAHLGARA